MLRGKIASFLISLPRPAGAQQPGAVSGTAVSLPCQGTAHILLLLQLRAFPTRKSFRSHNEHFCSNLFAVNAVSYFKVTSCVPGREEGIAREGFFEGGVSNLPLRLMKMQILPKWH